jgi:hypothetical protein
MRPPQKLTRRQILATGAIAAGAGSLRVAPSLAIPTTPAIPAIPPFDFASVPVTPEYRLQLLDLVNRIDKTLGQTATGFNPFFALMACEKCGSRLKKTTIYDWSILGEYELGPFDGARWKVAIAEDGHFTVTADKNWFEGLCGNSIFAGDDDKEPNSICQVRVIQMIVDHFQDLCILTSDGEIKYGDPIERLATIECGDCEPYRTFTVPGTNLDFTVGKYNPADDDWVQQDVTYQGNRYSVDATHAQFEAGEWHIYAYIESEDPKLDSLCVKKSDLILI